MRRDRAPLGRRLLARAAPPRADLVEYATIAPNHGVLVDAQRAQGLPQMKRENGKKRVEAVSDTAERGAVLHVNVRRCA